MSSVCRCVVEFLCYKSSNFVEMMASFLLHWSLEFLLAMLAAGQFKDKNLLH